MPDCIFSSNNFGSLLQEAEKKKPRQYYTQKAFLNSPHIVKKVNDHNRHNEFQQYFYAK